MFQSDFTSDAVALRGPEKEEEILPELALVGHEGAVYGIDFNPTGNYLCSGSLDKNICTNFYLFNFLH